METKSPKSMSITLTSTKVSKIYWYLKAPFDLNLRKNTEEGQNDRQRLTSATHKSICSSKCICQKPAVLGYFIKSRIRHYANLFKKKQNPSKPLNPNNQAIADLYF